MDDSNYLCLKCSCLVSRWPVLLSHLAVGSPCSGCSGGQSMHWLLWIYPAYTPPTTCPVAIYSMWSILRLFLLFYRESVTTWLLAVWGKCQNYRNHMSLIFLVYCYINGQFGGSEVFWSGSCFSFWFGFWAYPNYNVLISVVDPELLPVSGSGIIVPDPAKYEREEFFFFCEFWTVPVVWNRKGQIVDRFFFMIEFKVVFLLFPKLK